MDRQTVYRKTQALVNDGANPSMPPAGSVTVAEPVEILRPAGDLEGWFVGLVADDKLLGFIRFNSDLSEHRYSSFQRHADSLAGCPDAVSWLDPAAVLARAGSVSAVGDELGEPVLSYDQVPDRIAWTVTATGENGDCTIIYVAGEHVYTRENPGDR